MKVTPFILALIIFFQLRSQEKQTNIIFMIGDGTGLSQITAGMYANGNKTNLEQFGVIGLIKTHTSDNLVTDSAASGTSMASGVKTQNGVIGFDLNGTEVSSILEDCEKMGYNSGLIATSSIVHATPASFYANVSSRRLYEEIALQLVESEIDYFIGGGREHFNKRTDNRNLITEKNSFKFVNNLSEFESSQNERVGFFTSDLEPKSILEGREPKLANGIQSMLTKLDAKEKSFFLMVEGAQIDWGGHANIENYLLSEFKDFDEAIGIAIQYTKANPNTLLIVTADHETGGTALNSGDIKTFTPKLNFTTKNHTASMVPIFAMGKGAENFAGIYDNTLIYNKLKSVLAQ